MLTSSKLAYFCALHSELITLDKMFIVIAECSEFLIFQKLYLLIFNNFISYYTLPLI